jgi:hypothetical protein
MLNPRGRIPQSTITVREPKRIKGGLYDVTNIYKNKEKGCPLEAEKARS